MTTKIDNKEETMTTICKTNNGILFPAKSTKVGSKERPYDSLLRQQDFIIHI